MLFDGMAGGKYKRVSRRAQLLTNFQMTDGQWENLLIPINMAFFFRSSLEERMVTLYPSPAGAVESLLPLDAWNEIVEENPALAQLRPDIEALLVNRVGHAQELSRAEYYIAPIDECYRLVGLIRANWKGLSGGTEVWTEIGRFFCGAEIEGRPGRRGGPCLILSFKIEQAAWSHSRSPQRLRSSFASITQSPAQTIHTVALRCQIQIEVTRRRYTPEEQASMLDLFGEPERWSQTLRSLLGPTPAWLCRAFRTPRVTDLHVPCTFDFNVAATKYFEGLTDGEIPLHFLFSGTVFYADAEGVLQVAPISWEQEARYKLPVNVWREMMEAYYPNTVWLNLRRDVFDRLYQYKIQHGLPTWEQALESMLAGGRDGEHMSPNLVPGRSRRSPRRCSTRDTCCIPIARPR